MISISEKANPKLLMLKGLPASGKTSFARKLVEEGWTRVNKDDLRAMMHNSHHGKGKESSVIGVRDYVVAKAATTNQNVVVDDTNFNPIHERSLSALAKGYGMDFEVKFFDVPLEECIARDAKREKPVGEMVIRDMYNKYLGEVKQAKYVPDRTKPAAFIFDIDGTLALMDGRSPYDYSKVGTDTLNKGVALVAALLSMSKMRIIVVSGRDGSCREATKEWFQNKGLTFYDEIHMRQAGDTRKDTVIKKEIFFRDIAPHYNVQGVFDDRDSVVKMWRELGLTCFQVAEGNF